VRKAVEALLEELAARAHDASLVENALRIAWLVSAPRARAEVERLGATLAPSLALAAPEA
jgi:hypothetical protein